MEVCSDPTQVIHENNQKMEGRLVVFTDASGKTDQ